MHQFSRDASVAEAWLLGQEPYLSSREIGQSVDEVEKLIKRHEAFEKSAATWDERFSALERLTTVSHKFQLCLPSGSVAATTSASSVRKILGQEGVWNFPLLNTEWVSGSNELAQGQVSSGYWPKGR